MLKYAKALVGGLIAGLSSAGTALQVGGHFGWSAIIAAIVAGLITFSGVAFTPPTITK
jgi:hypothetical protein